MADISKISIDGGRTEYEISDDVARASIEDIEDVIPSGASTTNQLVDQASVDTALSAIEDVIPSEATSSNQLVDQTSLDTALSGKVNTSSVGANNGVASLDNTGKVPSSQLPSYVDDVIEGYLYEGSFYEDAQHTELITPESSKIYVDLSTDKTYRWSGTVYVDVTGASAWGEIGGNIANQTDLVEALEDNLDETSVTAEKMMLETIGRVNKNLLPINKTTTTVAGVTLQFVNNSDGELERIALSGTAISTLGYELGEVRLAQGTYIVSFKPDSVIDTDEVYLHLTSPYRSMSVNVKEDGYTFTLDNTATITVSLHVSNGYVFDSDRPSIYPMIRSSVYADPTFYPYCESTIDSELDDIRSELDEKIGGMSVSDETLIFS